MALPDRLLPLCDLLLGAAHADKQLQDREREEVRELLADLTGAALTAEVEDQLARFDAAHFDLAATAAAFREDPIEDRERLLHLVAAVHDADEELDFAEDEYLRALAAALALPASSLAGLTLDVEIEERREVFHKVRKGPPPPPLPRKAGGAAGGATDADTDVDLD